MKFMIIEADETLKDALRAHEGFYKTRRQAINDASRRLSSDDFYVIQVPRLLKKKKPKRGPK